MIDRIPLHLNLMQAGSPGPHNLITGNYQFPIPESGQLLLYCFKHSNIQVLIGEMWFSFHCKLEDLAFTVCHHLSRSALFYPVTIIQVVSVKKHIFLSAGLSCDWAWA